MGLPLSGFNQWPGIVGDTSKDDSPIRNDLVLGFNSYVYDSAKESVVNTSQPRGGYISRGWKIIVGDRQVDASNSKNQVYSVRCKTRFMHRNGWAGTAGGIGRVRTMKPCFLAENSELIAAVCRYSSWQIADPSFSLL